MKSIVLIFVMFFSSCTRTVVNYTKDETVGPYQESHLMVPRNACTSMLYWESAKGEMVYANGFYGELDIERNNDLTYLVLKSETGIQKISVYVIYFEKGLEAFKSQIINHTYTVLRDVRVKDVKREYVQFSAGQKYIVSDIIYFIDGMANPFAVKIGDHYIPLTQIDDPEILVSHDCDFIRST